MKNRLEMEWMLFKRKWGVFLCYMGFHVPGWVWTHAGKIPVCERCGCVFYH